MYEITPPVPLSLASINERNRLIINMKCNTNRGTWYTQIN